MGAGSCTKHSRDPGPPTARLRRRAAECGPVWYSAFRIGRGGPAWL